MSEKKRIVAVCPDCLDVYWQEVPDGYDGPKKVPNRREVALRALVDQADDVGGPRMVYYRMRCADCSVRLAPPALKETLRKWLQVGEKK
jgi:uncharacterized protein with PIN domain